MIGCGAVPQALVIPVVNALASMVLNLIRAPAAFIFARYAFRGKDQLLYLILHRWFRRWRW